MQPIDIAEITVPAGNPSRDGKVSRADLANGGRWRAGPYRIVIPDRRKYAVAPRYARRRHVPRHRTSAVSWFMPPPPDSFR